MDVLSIVNGALLIMTALLPFAFYRVAFGGNIRPKTSHESDDEEHDYKEQKVVNRLIGVDLITNLLVGIVVLLAIVENTDTTIDIGIVIAALSFAGTISIARYISEGRVI